MISSGSRRGRFLCFRSGRVATAFDGLSDDDGNVDNTQSAAAIRRLCSSVAPPELGLASIADVRGSSHASATALWIRVRMVFDACSGGNVSVPPKIGGENGKVNYIRLR